MTSDDRSAHTTSRQLPTRLPAWLTSRASRLYGQQVAKRAARFDQGQGVVRLDRPVISVGNLSVGGTGKTPVVQWIVAQLRAAGHDPCIAMRGYRSRHGLSDEAQLHRMRFDDLPVVAQPDRVEGLIELFSTERGEVLNCVVLDDGFQHRRIARDLDLVLIDATRDPFDDALLPQGWLREPVEALKRATHLAITHAQATTPERIEALQVRLQGYLGRRADAVLCHHWTGLEITYPTGQNNSEQPLAARADGAADDEMLPTGWLAGKRVVAACAIAQPQQFLSALSRAVGGEVPAMVFADHHPYPPASVRTIIGATRDHGAQALVVTPKDWTKLRRVDPSRWPCPVVRPRLEILFASGEETLTGAVLEAAKHRPDQG